MAKDKDLAEEQGFFSKKLSDIVLYLSIGFVLGGAVGSQCSPRHPERAYLATSQQAPKGDLDGDSNYPDLVIDTGSIIGNKFVPLYCQPQEDGRIDFVHSNYKTSWFSDLRGEYDRIEDKLNGK